jgi:phosphatidylglycerol:prolipoprotein diacylglycerol transferase
MRYEPKLRYHFIFWEIFSLDFSPSFKIFGWEFHWYGIIIAVGFLLAVIYAMKRSKRFGLTEDNIIDLLIYAVPLAFVGLRLYFVAFSDWDFSGNIWQNLLRIVKIWEGGLAIYGGIIGGLIGALIFSKVKKIKIGPIADIGALGLLIGQAIGRWGNFVNREAFGMKTNVPWKMGLTTQNGTF